MKLEKGVISGSQLLFLTAGFLQGSLLTLTFVDEISKHDTWLSIIAALILTLPMALVYINLSQKFPQKNLIQILDIIYGPYLGKLISIQYIWLFLSIFAANLWFIANFFLTYFMPETPILAFVITFALLCTQAVRYGIEVIARTSFLFVLLTVLITAITFLLLLKDMSLDNFLPVFDISLKDFIHSTHILITIPFCEIFTFLMVIPSLSDQRKTKSSILIGLLIGGLTMLIVAIRNIAALGPIAEIVSSSSMEAVRLINIADILTRLEVLLAISFLVSLFLKASVFYYATVLSLAQLTKQRSYLPLVIPIGIISISLAMTNQSSIEFDYSGRNTFPFLGILSYILIPLLSLIIAKLRKLPK